MYRTPIQEFSQNNADSDYNSMSLSAFSIGNIYSSGNDDEGISISRNMNECSISSSISSSLSATIDTYSSSIIAHQRPMETMETNFPLIDSTNVFSGTIIEFMKSYLSEIPWYKWDPMTDIRDRLDSKILESGRDLIWGQDEDDQEFEALNAARDGDEAVVAFAVFIAKNHRCLNTMNNQRQTILHIAAESCSSQLCRLIVTRGADGAIADVWGDTPLHIASRLGRADVVKALTTSLTKPEVRHPYFRVPYKSLPQDNVRSYNHDGRMPVHLATQLGYSSNHRQTLYNLSKYARANMDDRRLGDGYSPAHIAIENGDLHCLQVCLESGSDSEVRNFKSETPQQLAYLFGYNSMVALCQMYGSGVYQLDYAETEAASYEDESDTEK